MRGLLPRLALALLDFTLNVRERRRRAAHKRRCDYVEQCRELDGENMWGGR